MLPPLLVLARRRRLGGSTCAPAASTTWCCPLPPTSRRRCGTTARCCGRQPAGDGAGGRPRHPRRDRRRGRRSRSLIHRSELSRRALYPLMVGSQAVPSGDPRAAARPLGRLRHRAEARDHRARLLLPGRRDDLDGLRAVDLDLLKLMRTLDASRWQTLRFAELPPPCRPRCPARRSPSRSRSSAPYSPSPRAPTAGLGHPAAAVDPAARDPARLRRDVSCCRLRGRPLRGARACRAADS